MQRLLLKQLVNYLKHSNGMIVLQRMVAMLGTHAVVAQRVETAMSDAGLCRNYTFFISTTWWEADHKYYSTQEEAPEGATERNRKGIRYLSYYHLLVQQRRELTNIEARLDALEAE